MTGRCTGAWFCASAVRWPPATRTTLSGTIRRRCAGSRVMSAAGRGRLCRSGVVCQAETNVVWFRCMLAVELTEQLNSFSRSLMLPLFCSTAAIVVARTTCDSWGCRTPTLHDQRCSSCTRCGAADLPCIDGELSAAHDSVLPRLAGQVTIRPLHAGRRIVESRDGREWNDTSAIEVLL